MPDFEYSRWDGSQEFSPQSADRLFDELSRYLLDYGEELLDNFDRWEEEQPDIVQKLVERGHIERDEAGRWQITPRGMKRVESRALEELFEVTRRDGTGRHETEFRGAGQTVHEESRPYEFGDPVSSLNLHETLRNALARQGGGTPVHISSDDLVVHDTEYQTSCASVVLIDMSGSMSLHSHNVWLLPV